MVSVAVVVYLILLINVCQVISNKRLKRKDTLDACADVRLLNKSAFILPDRFETLERPWIRSGHFPDAKLISTDALADNWEWIQHQNVRGTNLTDVFGYLRRNGCLVIPYGGTVRDLIQGRVPRQVHVRSSCDGDTVRKLCMDKYGIENCLGRAGQQISPWNFDNSAVAWGYTPESLAYFDDGQGNQAVVDLSGRGFADVCQKRIGIGFNRSRWDEWYGGRKDKLMQYWKLRSDGYSPRNISVQNFIVDKVKKDGTSADFYKLYCQQVYGGVMRISNQNFWWCDIDQMLGSRELIDRKEAIEGALRNDLGQQFFRRSIRPLVSHMQLRETAPSRQTAPHTIASSLCLLLFITLPLSQLNLLH